MVVKKEIFFITATVLLVYSGMTLIFPVLPFYLAKFGGDETEFGYAASAFALAVLIFSPIIGRIADRFGKVRVIGTSLLGYSIANYLFIFVGNYWHIVILRFFEGMTTAGVVPAAISIASDISEESNRARSIAFVTAGVSAGIIIGPLIGGTLILTYPLSFPFVVSGTLALLGAFAAFNLLKEPKVEHSETEDSNVSMMFDPQRAIDNLPKPLLAFAMVLIFQMVINISWLLIEPGFVYYFYDDLGYNSQQFGLFVASYGAFVLVGEVFFGGLSDRFGRKIVIFIGSIIHGIFYIYLSYATNLVNIILAGMVAGIGLGLIGPALNALVSEVCKPEKRTFVFGVVTAFAGIAQVAGPLTGGYVVDHGFPVTSLSLVSAGIVLGSALLVPFLNFVYPYDVDTQNDVEELNQENPYHNERN